MAEIGEPMPEGLNTSGKGKFQDIPADIEGWAWGAFFLTWLWALGNRTWVGLYTLLPVAAAIALSQFNLARFFPYNMEWAVPCLMIFCIVVALALHYQLGMYGRKWAWQNRTWRDVAHFRRVQLYWSIAGFVVVGLIVLAIALVAWHQHKVDTGISTTIAQAREVARKVGTYMDERGRIPATLEDAGVTAPYGDDIADLSFDSATGQIKVQSIFPEFEGKTFTLAPMGNREGQVEWRCLAGQIPRDDMPRDCRFDVVPPFAYKP